MKNQRQGEAGLRSARAWDEGDTRKNTSGWGAGGSSGGLVFEKDAFPALTAARREAASQLWEAEMGLRMGALEAGFAFTDAVASVQQITPYLPYVLMPAAMPFVQIHREMTGQSARDGAEFSRFMQIQKRGQAEIYATVGRWSHDQAFLDKAQRLSSGQTDTGIAATLIGEDTLGQWQKGHHTRALATASAYIPLAVASVKEIYQIGKAIPALVETAGKALPEIMMAAGHASHGLHARLAEGVWRWESELSALWRIGDGLAPEMAPAMGAGLGPKPSGAAKGPQGAPINWKEIWGGLTGGVKDKDPVSFLTQTRTDLAPAFNALNNGQAVPVTLLHNGERSGVGKFVAHPTTNEVIFIRDLEVPHTITVNDARIPADRKGVRIAPEDVVKLWINGAREGMEMHIPSAHVLPQRYTIEQALAAAQRFTGIKTHLKDDLGRILIEESGHQGALPTAYIQDPQGQAVIITAQGNGQYLLDLPQTGASGERPVVIVNGTPRRWGGVEGLVDRITVHAGDVIQFGSTTGPGFQIPASR